MGDPRPSHSHHPEEIEKKIHGWAEKGDHKKISESLSNRPEHDCKSILKLKNQKGELPAHRAAYKGRITCLKILIPEDQKYLADEKNAEGRSSLHFAAAQRHANTVKWLVQSRNATVDLQDNEGNTPLHLAVPLGEKGKLVVKNLVTSGADLFILNKEERMPISLYNDPALFDVLFSKYTGKSDNGVYKEVPADGDKRNILHYAARFPADPDKLGKLIAGIDPAHWWDTDIAGNSFLDVAAKYGNTTTLQALQKIDKGKQCTPSPELIQRVGLCALLHKQGSFFDELIKYLTEGKISFTLLYIVESLVAGLMIDDSQIKDRLPLFASTLPTYLALYAKKEYIFNFLLESKLISVNQWDEEHNRTCLHWAVIDERDDIVDKLCENVQLIPGVQDKDGKTALEYAVALNNHGMVQKILSARTDINNYEEKLYRDRDVYVQALNAILVGAALVASVTFAGWLQGPSTANFKALGMKIFWARNSASFFTAVATMCVTTAALLPTRNKYVGDTVKKLRFAIVVDAFFFALSLAAVMCAFATVGFAAVEDVHIFAYQAIMKGSIAVGGFLCLVVWLVFVIQVYKSAPPKSDIVALMPSQYIYCFPGWLNRLLGHDEENLDVGYRSLSRRELGRLMKKNLHQIYKDASATDHPITRSDDDILTDINKKLIRIDSEDRIREILQQERRDRKQLKQEQEEKEETPSSGEDEP